MKQCTFRCVIHGRGGHGAMPHEAIDPVVAAAALLRSSPYELEGCGAYVTWNAVRSGKKYNIIPEAAELSGTLCAPEQELPNAQEAFRQSVSAVLAALRSDGELSFAGEERD